MFLKVMFSSFPHVKYQHDFIFRPHTYCEKAKKYIYDGDIFQVVLSRKFSFDADGDYLKVYETYFIFYFKYVIPLSHTNDNIVTTILWSN